MEASMNPEGDVAARTRAFARAWFPVARDADLASPVLATLLGTRLVVFRTGGGEIVVLRNRCPHRGGKCGADGSCTHIPANGVGGQVPKNAKVDSYPVVTRYGLVWTCLGV